VVASIQKPKQPQGYFVFETKFNIIGGNIRIGYFGYLVVAFVFAAYFETILFVDYKIVI
jgi:hypothetical protein